MSFKKYNKNNKFFIEIFFAGDIISFWASSEQKAIEKLNTRLKVLENYDQITNILVWSSKIYPKDNVNNWAIGIGAIIGHIVINNCHPYFVTPVDGFFVDVNINNNAISKRIISFLKENIYGTTK